MFSYSRAVPGFVVLVLTGCGGGGSHDYLGYQRSLWNQRKPRSYRYTLSYATWVDSCNTMRVTVPVSGEPQVTTTIDCRFTSTNTVSMATTMEKVFALQGQMLSKAKDPLVAFHPDYGYPTHVRWSEGYNYYESLRITAFEVLEP